MRRRNFEGDYNLLIEMQTKYEETLKSYHEHHMKQVDTDDKSVETEDKEVKAQNDDKKREKDG